MPDRSEGVVFRSALELAQRFPGVEPGTSYGTPAIKVRGKLLGRLRTEAEGWLAIKCDFDDREVLLRAAPHIFHLTDHYAKYPMILVDLTEIDDEALVDVLEQAWRMTAPEKLILEYDDET